MPSTLTDKIVVGAMLVSQSDDILDLTIPGLLKWCDWVVLVMDNESPEVLEKVNKYQKLYYDKIWVRRSSVPHRVFSRSGQELTYHERWKAVKGVVRHDVFQNLKSILALNQEGYTKIDILLWPDHDILFTEALPELLNTLILSDYQGVSMKHVDAVGNLRSISESDIGHHVHILKYSSDLAGLPRRFFGLFYPLTEKEVIKVENYSVHLAYLTEKNRGWRSKNWKTDKVLEREFVKLDKDVNEMSPKEIYEKLS